MVLVCCICCTSTDQIVLMSPLFATEEGTSFVDNAVTLPKFTEVVSALNEAVRTPSDSWMVLAITLIWQQKNIRRPNSCIVGNIVFQGGAWGGSLGRSKLLGRVADRRVVSHRTKNQSSLLPKKRRLNPMDDTF